MSHDPFMQRAVQLALENMRGPDGGPFGAVIVRNGEIIAEGTNQVAPLNDPTAHAEVVAIRRACEKLKTFHLRDCDIYTSCEPCPMCLGAIYWTHLRRIYYANTRAEAAAVDFDDDFIYREIPLAPQARSIPAERITTKGHETPFAEWAVKPDKIQY